MKVRLIRFIFRRVLPNRGSSLASLGVYVMLKTEFIGSWRKESLLGSLSIRTFQVLFKGAWSELVVYSFYKQNPASSLLSFQSVSLSLSPSFCRFFALPPLNPSSLITTPSFGLRQ
jgi:hypothetical protein